MMRVKICCSNCGRRLFDYESGNINMEMKCGRCKRIIVFDQFSEKVILEKIKNGVVTV